MNAYKVRGTKVTLPYSPELTPAEIRLVFRLQHHFDPTNIFPELYLPRYAKKSGTTPSNLMLGGQNLLGSEVTQIDCLTLSVQGVFVFESKDYVGYIYGNGRDRYWTQVTQYGQAKYRFYNPIRQNQTHIRALEEILGPDFPIYSVVVFGPDATLKSILGIPGQNFVINHVNIPQLLQKLPQNQLSSDQIAKIRALITANRLLPTPNMRRDHAADTTECFETAPDSARQ